MFFSRKEFCEKNLNTKNKFIQNTCIRIIRIQIIKYLNIILYYINIGIELFRFCKYLSPLKINQSS